MSPKSEHVLRELLTIGFRAYPRGLANGILFASVTTALLWDGMPHGMLAVWLACFVTLVTARFGIARSFLRAAPPAEELERWARRAAFGYGATGFAWGLLAAAAMIFAPQVPLYSLWTVFLIAIFAVLQAQTTGSHPVVFRAFTLCAFAPVLAACLLLSSPHYATRLVGVVVLLAMSLLVGRSGNRYMVDSIAIRNENVELLNDLRIQKEELDRANSAKTRFLAAASHDLRQPMQAIALLVESLQERVHEPGTRKIVGSIRSSVVAMSTLLDEILDISKLDAGTVRPRPAVFPAARVLDRLRASFSQAAAQKSLGFRVRPSEAVVETDEVLLYRILANLVQNALRYTERGGVLVGCRRRPEGVAIEVWDTGIGIPSDQLTEVFREFYQVGNPQRDRDQGLGLGLAIVERTARTLGLPLRLRSRLGRGSVFSIVVPHGDPARVGAAEAAAPESLEGCAVLVVEDDRDIRGAITVLLEGWRCNVAVASSPPEVDGALERLGAEPDAIVADYRLPGGESGVQLIARVRERHPGASAVLVTGDVAPEVLQEAQAAGLPLLHKPLRPARLRTLLAAALRRRRASRRAPPAQEVAREAS